MIDLRERNVWEGLIGKQVCLNKQINERTFFYNGVIIAVQEDKILFNDKKLGEIPLAFKGLSVISFERGGQ